MAPKAIHLCIQVDGLLPQAANILKQEMLAKGGEVAVPSSALRLDSGRISCIVLGTLAQLERLAPALDEQPFELSELATRLRLICALAGSKPLWLPRKTGAVDIGGLVDCDVQTPGVHDVVANSIAHAWNLVEQRCSFLVVEGSNEAVMSRVVGSLGDRAACPVAVWVHGATPHHMKATTPLVLDPDCCCVATASVDAPIFAVCRDPDPLPFLSTLLSGKLDTDRLFVTSTVAPFAALSALPRLDCMIVRETDMHLLQTATQANALAHFLQLGTQTIITDCPSLINQLLAAFGENPWKS